MIDDHNLELINAGIDGELNESEQSELQQLLDQSSEARLLQADLLALAKTIADVPQQDPPDNLRKQILEKVQLPGKPKQAFRFLELPAFARYGLAVTAGLIMIVGIYQLGPRDSTPEDLTRMTGTISQQPPAGQAVVLDSLAIELDMISGMVSLQGSGDKFILEFDLKTTAAVEVVVELSDSGLQFGSFKQAGNSLADAKVMDGTIRVSAVGDQQFALILWRSNDDPGVEPVRVTTKIFSGGARVYQGELKSQ